jgi:hypothetical protein
MGMPLAPSLLAENGTIGENVDSSWLGLALMSMIGNDARHGTKGKIIFGEARNKDPC